MAADTALFGRWPCVQGVRQGGPRYGEVDELNATVGWAITQVSDGQIKQRTRDAPARPVCPWGQNWPPRPRQKAVGVPDTPGVPDERLGQMESWMDEADAELPELRVFILPGGTTGARRSPCVPDGCVGGPSEPWSRSLQKKKWVPRCWPT